MRRPWCFISLKAAAEVQQATALLTAKWLWHRVGGEKAPYHVERIEVREWDSTWSAAPRKAATGEIMLCLCLEDTWRRGGGTLTEWDGSETYVTESSGVKVYWASDLYLTWAEARGGWPLVGDCVVAKLPEGDLHTTVVEVLPADDGGDCVLPTGRRVPIAALRQERTE